MASIGRSTLICCSTVLIFFQLVQALPQGGNCCSLHYLTEPVSHFTCNPFHEDHHRIKLECNVYKLLDIGDAQMLEIEWFRILISNVDEEPEHLTNTVNKVRIKDVINHGIKKSRLQIITPAEQDVGDYWCKVFVHDENGTVLYDTLPSQRAKLQPPQYYRSLPPCPYVFLFEAVHKCAEGISAPSDSTSCPSSDPNLEVSPSPAWPLYSNVPITKITVLKVPLYSHSPLVTPTANGTNLANLASEPPIPAWGYGIIAAGVVIAACSIAVILAALYIRKRITQSLPTSTMHQAPPDAQTHMHDPNTLAIPRHPFILPRATRPPQTGLPSHLSISRQRFEYVGANNNHPVKKSVKATATDFQSGDSPVHSNNKPLNHRETKVGVVVSHASTTPASASCTVVKQGHEYQIIDPQVKDAESKLYTSLKLTNGSQCSQILANPSELEVSQSGAYYQNEKRYQALNPETKDYMSLYSTPAGKQRHRGEKEQ